MQIIKRNDLEMVMLPGRKLQKAVGKDALSRSSRMTMGFATYSAESGPMEPHHHAEEIVYILSADKGWVRHGPEPDKLGSPVPLAAGMTLHIPPLEWHVFEYDEGGHVDIIYFYGQVDNIRPEEVEQESG
jgi:mannose-6-phosphate isomerase-like protein (cupin superfamily)